MHKVSIIMPVYNSEKYLEKAIKSVLNQTYTNFELISVDDGSTDDSLSILKKYEEIDSRIKVYHKPNGGISSTRNYGLKKATGKYIAFLDNDDEYLPELLEENVLLLEKYEADMVKFQKLKRYIKNEETLNLKENKEQSIYVFEEEEIWKNFQIINKFGGTIWNILYKKEFLDENNICFSTISKNEIEDHRFNLDCYKHVTKIVCNTKYYYLWNVRVEHSTTGKFIKERFENIKKEGNSLYTLLKEKNIEELNPCFWSKIKVSYLINILVVMNYDNSDYNNRKSFVNYLKQLKKIELFQRKCNRKDIKYLLKNETKVRTFVCMLFDLNCYNLIYLFSLKLKRDIVHKNRRF